MPGPEYYRKQAQVFASLALASRDPAIVARYNRLALEHLVKAEELEAAGGQIDPVVIENDGGSDMDRD